MVPARRRSISASSNERGRQPRRPYCLFLESDHLGFGKFGGKRSAYRHIAGLRFPVTKIDFPSPTAAFQQLDNGAFDSSVFHEVVSQIRNRQRLA